MIQRSLTRSWIESARALLFGTLMVLCAVATAFLGYFGVLLLYAAVTFDEEGSLGHVGMFIAAGLFPLLALFFGACTYLARRQFKSLKA